MSMPCVDPSAPHETLDVIYENAEMLVVNKPADIPMDGDGAVYKRTVESMVYDHMKARGIFDKAHERLQQEKKRKKQLKFVHQLDYGTSGVLCLAFTKDMAARLAHCFEMRATRKFYVALLHGHIPSDTSALENAVSPDLLDSAPVSDGEASCSPFATWVSACNRLWKELGRVHALGSSPSHAEATEGSVGMENLGGYRQLLQPFHGKEWGPAALRDRHGTGDVDSENAVHRYASTRASKPSLTTSTPVESSGLPADSLNRLLDRTLSGDLSAVTGVFLDLPVAYDVTDPSQFRMAVAAEKSRCATTSLWVLKRTFMSALEPPKKEIPPCDTSPHDHSSATRYPVTLVLLAPHTGRRHQLRVHCRAIGFPIFGDTLYSTELPWCPASLVGVSMSTWMTAPAQRMYLHAWRLLLPGRVTSCLDESERVALKKKRRRETLGLSQKSDVSISASHGEWTDFVAAVDFPGLDVGEAKGSVGV